MAWVDLLPQFPHLQIQSVQQECQHITIALVSTRENDQCPPCQTQTLNTHGWFTRCIHSLPSSGQAVVFLIQAQRFRCPNAACPRKTFREDLSVLADRVLRRTQGVTQ
ncbi:MAG: transposase, partial [Ktedonobacteraceae bacterium]|nr:transposase [Ktedonobacteraceae bacterium]